MMEDIYWVFGCKRYESIKDFIDAVQTKCDEISPDEHGWKPYSHVCDGPLIIEFEMLWKDPPDDMIYFEVTPDSRSLTQAEILYKLNHDSFQFFENIEHRFFEGIGQHRNGNMSLLTGKYWF